MSVPEVEKMTIKHFPECGCGTETDIRGAPRKRVRERGQFFDKLPLFNDRAFLPVVKTNVK